MMFVARLLQEKCREQHQSLFFAFNDLTKAFDTVKRELLWKVLSKFGCPPHFLQIFREFHDGMSARVTVGGHESDPFDVLVGVKQGCVLAPVRVRVRVRVRIMVRVRVRGCRKTNGNPISGLHLSKTREILHVGTREAPIFTFNNNNIIIIIIIIINNNNNN